MSSIPGTLSIFQQMKMSCVEAFQFDSASLMNPMLLVIISVVAVVGSVCQIIGLNFWLRVDAKGPFTTSAVVAIFWDIVLFLVFAVWAIKLALRNQSSRFDFLWTDWTVLAQLFAIGALEGAGTLSVAYAALGTNESLQSVISATVVPATAIFTIFVMRFDPGVTTRVGQLWALCTWQSASAVVLILGAVAMLAFGGQASAPAAADDAKKSSWLPWICFLGAIFNAFHFVLQGHFMDSHTLEHKSYEGEEGLLMYRSSPGLNGAANDADLFLDDSDENNNNTSSAGVANKGVTSGNGHNNSTTNTNTVSSGNGNIQHQQQQQPHFIDSCASSHDNVSVPIIESGLNNRMSVNVVSTRDNTVAGALHNHHNSNLSNPNSMSGLSAYDEEDDNVDNDDDGRNKNRHAGRGTGGGSRGKNGGGGSASSQTNGSQRGASSSRRSPFAVRSDDFTVKISMLAIDTFFQIVFTFICLPLDAIHGFGAHDTVGDAWSAFSTDFAGIFHNEPVDSSKYFVLFLFGWCSSHLAFAYLNHYSPTYTPMVMILASPITNIILLIAPSWNAHDKSPVVWASIVSAILMIAASVLFGLFEVGRKKKKIENMQRF